MSFERCQPHRCPFGMKRWHRFYLFPSKLTKDTSFKRWQTDIGAFSVDSIVPAPSAKPQSTKKHCTICIARSSGDYLKKMEHCATIRAQIIKMVCTLTANPFLLWTESGTSNDDWPVNTNKQWSPLVSKWSEMDFVHPLYESFRGTSAA